MDNERDYILFYRSFYESIKCMPGEVQLEIYPAVFEYWFFQKQPKNLSEVAKGLFTLMKPIIDRNRTRVENGKKGGHKRATSEPVKGKAVSQGKEIYNMTFEEEVERMKADKDWLDIIYHDFNITPDELNLRFASFLDSCKKTKGKPHDSYEDAQSHLRYWMAKAFTKQEPAPQSDPDNLPPPDYTFNGGFGGLDV